MDHLKDKLSRLASDQPSAWRVKAEIRRKSRNWLKKASLIAQQILVALKSQSLSQKELADRICISPEQIANIVKGQENLTLEAIAKLEIALDIEILKPPASK